MKLQLRIGAHIAVLTIALVVTSSVPVMAEPPKALQDSGDCGIEPSQKNTMKEKDKTWEALSFFEQGPVIAAGMIKDDDIKALEKEVERIKGNNKCYSVCVRPVSYTHLDVYKRQEADKWEALFVVARLADVTDGTDVTSVTGKTGYWETKARNAALAFQAEDRDTEPTSNGELLLRDIECILGNYRFGSKEAVRTEILLDRLHGISESPCCLLYTSRCV